MIVSYGIIGTALYEAVAALFIAQLRNVQLSFGNIVAVR
jgi:Na+/H+-dicarboxylate symporter